MEKFLINFDYAKLIPTKNLLTLREGKLIHFLQKKIRNSEKTVSENQCSKRDSNSHGHFCPKDFKSFVSTIPPFERPWSGKRDSNSRPQPWQGCALPTELFPQINK